MKQKLLFLALFVQCVCYAQIQINDFFNAPTSYALVALPEDVTIDQSSEGAGLTWDFNSFTKIGNTEDVYSTATSDDIAMYPGTTSVLTTTNTDTMSEGKIFIKQEGNMISATAFVSPYFNFILNYSTDNFLMGSYPLNYSDPATVDSNIAGGYTYTAEGNTYVGTFTGTAETNVDAYGTLTTNIDGNEEFSGSVTRIKIVQNLDLSFPPFGNIATATLTTYNYYDDNGNIVFRSNRLQASITTPVTFNEDLIAYEAVLVNTLRVNQTELAHNNVKIVPNPVADFLNISVDNNQIIKSISITDTTGKEVLKYKGENSSLSISHLQTGFYIANVTTENNHFTRKFIKK